MKYFFSILIILICFSSCSKYQQVLKSTDLEFKFEMAVKYYNEKNIKIVTNAGGLNPSSMANKIEEIIQELNLDLKVSYYQSMQLGYFMFNLSLTNIFSQRSFL